MERRNSKIINLYRDHLKELLLGAIIPLEFGPIPIAPQHTDLVIDTENSWWSTTWLTHGCGRAKITGACFIDHKLWSWDLSYSIYYYVGNPISYKFRPISFHVFIEGCLALIPASANRSAQTHSCVQSTITCKLFFLPMAT